MLQASPKPVACKHCRQPFTPFTTLKAKACSVPCALALVEAKKAREAEKVRKVERAATRKALEKFKKRKVWLKEAQEAFNKFIRLRDSGKPCICCGKPMGEQRFGGAIDAGHWLGVGAAPHLRFDEQNVHAQAKSCNRPGGANRAAFKSGMIERIGLAAVKRLESDQTPRKFTIDDLRDIRDRYRRLAREIVVTVADSS